MVICAWGDRRWGAAHESGTCFSRSGFGVGGRNSELSPIRIKRSRTLFPNATIYVQCLQWITNSGAFPRDQCPLFSINYEFRGEGYLEAGGWKLEAGPMKDALQAPRSSPPQFGAFNFQLSTLDLGVPTTPARVRANSMRIKRSRTLFPTATIYVQCLQWITNCGAFPRDQFEAPSPEKPRLSRLDG